MDDDAKPEAEVPGFETGAEAEAPQQEAAEAPPQPSPPLWLPPGSIRALLALLTVGLLWYLLCSGGYDGTSSVVASLEIGMVLVLGYYFGTRKGRPTARAIVSRVGRPPLYLPRGAVRIIIFGGFVGTTVHLVRTGMLRDDPEHMQLWLVLILAWSFLVGAFLNSVFGIIARRFFEPGLRAAVGHVRAVITVGVTLVFVVMVAAGFECPQGLDKAYLGLLAFYFGSR